MSKIKTSETIAAETIAREAGRLFTDQINLEEFTQAIQNTLKDKSLSHKQIKGLDQKVNAKMKFGRLNPEKFSQIQKTLSSTLLSESKKAEIEKAARLQAAMLDAAPSKSEIPATKVLEVVDRELTTLALLPTTSKDDKKLIEDTVAQNNELKSSASLSAKEVLTQASQNIKSLFEQVTGKENLGNAVGMKDSIFKKITGKEDLGKLVGIKESVFKTITGKKHLGEVLDKTAKMLGKAAASCKEGVTLAQAQISKTIIEPSKKKFTELTTRKNQNMR
jgi:hypothetical protein